MSARRRLAVDIAQAIASATGIKPGSVISDLIEAAEKEFAGYAVIAYEDHEQVERLADAWRAQTHATLGDARMTLLAYRLQAALREFADPTPRIEEPQGLGAVVEDEYGVRWVRVARVIGEEWAPHDKDRPAVGWRRITPVRILSEGVQP